MKTCCLTLLANRNLEDNLYARYIKILTDNEKYNFRKIEIEAISKLIDNIVNKKVFDNFYYSYRIPQIAKEFDLLKLDDNSIVNIEIKSEFDIDNMKKQLLQNRYYLSALNQTKKYFFSYCSENNKLYILDEEALQESNFCYLSDLLSEIDENYKSDINKLFSPSNYLVSPLNNTDKFLKRQYYLTNQQDYIKNKILKAMERKCQFVHILGKAGTGKTLLAYDIAIDLSKNNNICFIHCGILCKGHYELIKKSLGFEIISARQVNTMDLSKYNVIIIDEGQRIFRKTIRHIVDEIKNKELSCIIFEDPNQKLSYDEGLKDIKEYLLKNEISISLEEKLTTKIRTNPEISNFLQVLFDKRKKITKKYDNIEIIYANDMHDMISIRNLYQAKGYKYISYTPSFYNSSHLNIIDSSEFNTHKVIGQEFDNVVMYVDENFYYNEDGVLCSLRHPNPNYIYLKLLFQGLTRARFKICLIVWNNPDIMKQIMEIKEKKL